MTRPGGLASDAVARAALPIDEPPGLGAAVRDPEYVLCAHGYLRRGWCDECPPAATDWLDRPDPWLTARMADGR
jgi:hypothetical protein